MENVKRCEDFRASECFTLFTASIKEKRHNFIKVNCCIFKWKFFDNNQKEH